MTSKDVRDPLAQSVQTWLDDLRDQWLEELVSSRIRRAGLWNVVVGAALYGRLLSGEPGERRRILSALNRGKMDWQLSRPRAFFARLSSQQLDAMEGLALAALDALEEAMVSVEDLSGAARARTLLDICHRRDDLQAVRILLQGVRPDSAVASALDDFDPSGEEFIDECDPMDLPFDERLRRMAVFDVETWWTRPAEWMRDVREGPVRVAVAAAKVVQFPIKDLNLPVSGLQGFTYVPAAAAGLENGGARIIEHSEGEIDVRVRVTPTEELVVDVRFVGLPVPNANVTLELTAGGRVIGRFGPQVTNARGQALFGFRGAYPSPGVNEKYVVKVEPQQH